MKLTRLLDIASSKKLCNLPLSVVLQLSPWFCNLITIDLYWTYNGPTSPNCSLAQCNPSMALQLVYRCDVGNVICNPDTTMCLRLFSTKKEQRNALRTDLSVTIRLPDFRHILFLKCQFSSVPSISLPIAQLQIHRLVGATYRTMDSRWLPRGDYRMMFVAFQYSGWFNVTTKQSGAWTQYKNGTPSWLPPPWMLSSWICRK